VQRQAAVGRETSITMACDAPSPLANICVSTFEEALSRWFRNEQEFPLTEDWVQISNDLLEEQYQ